MRCSHCGQEMGSESVSVTIENAVGKPCVYNEFTGYLIGPLEKCVIMNRKCRGFMKKGCPFLAIQKRGEHPKPNPCGY